MRIKDLYQVGKVGQGAGEAIYLVNHNDLNAAQSNIFKQLLEDVKAGRIQIIVVYKIDRLTRSLTDFAKLVEIFDAHNVTFVSVTQQFNTTTSMGCLTLNVLLSFAHYEREITGERIRDKCAYPKSTFLVNLHVHVSVSDLSKKFDEVVTNIPYKNRAG